MTTCQAVVGRALGLVPMHTRSRDDTVRSKQWAPGCDRLAMSVSNDGVLGRKRNSLSVGLCLVQNTPRPRGSIPPWFSVQTYSQPQILTKALGRVRDVGRPVVCRGKASSDATACHGSCAAVRFASSIGFCMKPVACLLRVTG